MARHPGRGQRPRLQEDLRANQGRSQTGRLCRALPGHRQRTFAPHFRQIRSALLIPGNFLCARHFCTARNFIRRYVRNTEIRCRSSSSISLAIATVWADLVAQQQLISLAKSMQGLSNCIISHAQLRMRFPRVTVLPVHLAAIALTNRTIQHCRP